MKKAICKRNLESFDGTRIKKGEMVKVDYGMFYQDYDEVTVKIGRRCIRAVSVNDLEFVKE